MQALAIVISVLGSVISGMTLFFLQRYFRRKEVKDNERDRAKVKENILTMKAIHANGKLTEATAIAVRDGHTNGELKDALTLYEGVEQELFNYLLEQNANKK
jgi:Mn2+/Fe2+ NRAMP family transporter